MPPRHRALGAGLAQPRLPAPRRGARRRPRAHPLRRHRRRPERGRDHELPAPRVPAAEVCAIFARYGYSPADDSPFANRIFDPARRRRLLRRAAGGQADAARLSPQHELLRRRRRADRGPLPPRLPGEGDRPRAAADHAGLPGARGRRRRRRRRARARRARVPVQRRAQRAATATPWSSRRATARSARSACSAQAHALCATGDDGMVCVGRDYRVATDVRDARPASTCRAPTEHTHGIGSTLLSNTAVRAGEILGSILGHEAGRSEQHADLVGARPA